MIEQLQRKATKFILNRRLYESNYYDRLLKLNLLPIMYTFELTDIVFAIMHLSMFCPTYPYAGKWGVKPGDYTKILSPT